jgi:hypothetical protein
MNIRLTGCPSPLRAAGFEPISYRSIHLAAVDARIPARQINNIWYFSLTDVPKIAAALKLPRIKQRVSA